MRLHADEDHLRVFEQQRGQWVRQRDVAYADIQKVQFYPELHVVDENNGSFALRRCALRIRRAKKLHVSSAFVQSGDGTLLNTATNLASEFDEFINHVLNEVSEANPHAVIQEGWFLASLAWALVGVLGIGLLVTSVALVLYEPDLFSAIPALLFCLVFGAALVWLGTLFAIEYFPSRKRFKADP